MLAEMWKSGYFNFQVSGRKGQQETPSTIIGDIVLVKDEEQKIDRGYLSVIMEKYTKSKPTWLKKMMQRSIIGQLLTSLQLFLRRYGGL